MALPAGEYVSLGWRQVLGRPVEIRSHKAVDLGDLADRKVAETAHATDLPFLVAFRCNPMRSVVDELGAHARALEFGDALGICEDHRRYLAAAAFDSEVREGCLLYTSDAADE